MTSFINSCQTVILHMPTYFVYNFRLDEDFLLKLGDISQKLFTKYINNKKSGKIISLSWKRKMNTWYENFQNILYYFYFKDVIHT